MKAPDLNRTLVLEGATRVSDGAGGYTEVWATLGTLWAAIAPGSGRDVPGEELVLNRSMTKWPSSWSTIASSCSSVSLLACRPG